MIDLDAMPDDFVEVLLKDFEKHGVSVIERLRQESPRAYLALCGAIALEELRREKDEGEKY
jgi:hypothetical protein